MKENKTEQIRGEFKKKYGALVGWGIPLDLENWWLQKLSEQRQSILEGVNRLMEVNLAKIPPQLEDRGYQKALDTVISIIKK